MLKNYFKIAWRNLLKGKTYSVINIAGLASGMAVAFLIGLWIWDELTFDHYHENHNRIGQVMAKQHFNEGTVIGSSVALPLADELKIKYKDDFKHIALASRNITHVLAIGDKKLSQQGMCAEPALPEILGLKMYRGNYDAFKSQSTILLSHSLATALFGNEDPIDKLVELDNKASLKVAGVYEDLPHNTTFKETKFLLSWDNIPDWWKEKTTDWSNHICQLFVEINPYADFGKLTNKIKEVPTAHNLEFKEYSFIHPMDRWHLYSEFKDGVEDGGRIQFVWLFSIIGFFVLLLACINFMNLSTARSEKRAKEVGIRKAIGSLRKQLIIQFLWESVMVAFLALAVALVLVLLSLPVFNALSDKDISFPWSNTRFWAGALAFTIFTGLISGSYPALYLSGFDAIKVLKGTFSVGRLASLPRKILVVLQFTVSISLIIGTIIVFRQIQYAKSRPIGYAREGLISVPMNTDEIYKHYNELRHELIETGFVADMAESNSAPTEISWKNSGFTWPGKDPNTDPILGTIAVTHDFGKTVDWKIKEGRDFSRNFADSGAFIINESAAKLMGLKDPVGKIIRWNDKDHIVTGIVKDMVMESPYQPSVPTVFHVEYGWVNLILIRVNPRVVIREALAKIEPIYKKYNSGNPFDYKFIDEEYSRKFSNEERISNLATFFAILAIFISCLGLFGLASFIAEQRNKEIGIRKVLGASEANIWQLLSKDFAILVLISYLISIPLSWFGLHKWLQNYEYRTQLSWWVFAIAGISTLIITLLIVSLKTLTAARINPAKSLKNQ